MAKQISQALLTGANGICFSCLPSEDVLIEQERLKAIGFFAVHLRLWKSLLSKLPNFSEVWEWKTDELVGRIWNLEGEECLCLFVPNSSTHSLRLELPFVVREGFRAYGVRFPALIRLPLQRKVKHTIIKFRQPQPINLVWLTDNIERVQKLHQHTNELLPKAMQFAVQWALAKRERMVQDGKPLPEVEPLIWSMLQNAKRRQFSYGYLIACQILKMLGALPTPETLRT